MDVRLCHPTHACLTGRTEAQRKRNTMVGGDPSFNPIPPRCRIDQPALFLHCQPLNRPRRLNRPRQTMRLKVRLNGPGSLFRTPRRFDGLRQKFPDFLFHSGHPKRFRMLGKHGDPDNAMKKHHTTHGFLCSWLLTGTALSFPHPKCAPPWKALTLSCGTSQGVLGSSELASNLETWRRRPTASPSNSKTCAGNRQSR